MKFTLSWLKKHLDTTASLADICAALNRIGLEVESLDDKSDLAPFIIARIEQAVQHPDADRLRVCQVNDGTQILEIVCGAPNARAGIHVVLAPVGAKIPATGDVLKAGKIRGVASNGMLCSAKELNLGADSDGIMELPANAPLGASFAATYGHDDPVIEINLTPNRADCAGVRGIARDLAAAGLGTLHPMMMHQVTDKNKNTITITRQVDDTLCPLFATRVISGVKNGPSPEWLQKKLLAVGLRPISALVDITNYLTMDLARPAHVFDADKITGDALVIRTAQAGEILHALNDKDYVLPAGAVVIADGNGVQSLAGIMGGRNTGCDDNTQNIILEIALWDATNIAATGRALQINSDARYRFERGVDAGFALQALDYATHLVMELCGGAPSNAVVSGAVPPASASISLRTDRVNTLGGLYLPVAEQTRILTALGCKIEPSAHQSLNVTPPTWRMDLAIEDDLVEEILRIHGLDHIPNVAIARSVAVTQPALNPLQKNTGRVRRALAANGLCEAVTWSFLSQSHAEHFGGGAAALQIANPIAVDLSTMRPSLLPNLLLAAKRNHDRAQPHTALFEIGPVFMGVSPNDHLRMAGGVRTGRADRHWQGGGADVDIFAIKTDMLAALHAAGLPTGNLVIDTATPSYYHPGRSGAVRLGNRVAAYFGALHPATLQAIDIDFPAVAFEIFIDNIPLSKPKSTARPLLVLSPFNPITRDFAVVVDDDVAAGRIMRAARNADKNRITDVQIFDIYTGKGVESGKKSVAFSVTIQPQDKTLTDADIETLSASIITAVTKDTGGVLRA